MIRLKRFFRAEQRRTYNPTKARSVSGLLREYFFSAFRFILAPIFIGIFNRDFHEKIISIILFDWIAVRMFE